MEVNTIQNFIDNYWTAVYENPIYRGVEDGRWNNHLPPIRLWF